LRFGDSFAHSAPRFKFSARPVVVWFGKKTRTGRAKNAKKNQRKQMSSFAAFAVFARAMPQPKGWFIR
jgi:hypothetical protein